MTMPLEPTPLVISGGGDQAWRKLIPALFNLHLDKLLPERLAIVAVARNGGRDGQSHGYEFL